MDFYNNLNVLKPHKILVEFIKNNKNIKEAIDLGCGAGRDTKFLIKEGINVTAIDRIDVAKYLNNGLTEEERLRLNFIQSKFDDVNLPKADLIISYESLPFSNINSIKALIDKIKNALNDNGYFLCNFFGNNDSWNENKKITFLEKEEIEDLLKDFKILRLNEVEKDGKTAMHQIKHWHVFWIIAKKKGDI